ncbi:putative ribonuclease H-like domain-containing protein [Tanacetum coccineum]
MALMAFSDSEVLNDKTCSNSCLKSFENLKTQYDNLRVELNKTEFDLATYKRGLASVEEQLVFYKKNEVVFCDQIAVLKRDASFKDSEINALNIQLEKLKKEKESNQIKIDKFENASKSLDKFIGSQISGNHRKGVGFNSYNVVAPPPTSLFAPPTIDLSNSGLKEFQLPEFEGYGAKVNKSAYENSSNEIKKTTGAPIIEDWVLDSDEDESEVIVSENVQHKPEQVKQPRNVSENPRNKRTNWNEKKTQKLGVGVSQMCDKKNSVLFTETKCLILSPDFKLPDENQVMLKIPRKDNMYSFDLKNIVPSKGLTCLIAKATNDESKMWHKRLGHINFKTMNKLVKGNLVKGLPSKIFENDHTCVACQKGKQHKATCKTKLVNTISQPLQILHMDLFGPTFVKSIMGKMYCLVVTDDYSRFSWVFFLAKKDETSGILKNFITKIENQLNHKVKVIRSDNGTEFKNYEMNQFCGNARTPQQNGVAERKNRTLIEAKMQLELVG